MQVREYGLRFLAGALEIYKSFRRCQSCTELTINNSDSQRIPTSAVFAELVHTELLAPLPSACRYSATDVGGLGGKRGSSLHMRKIHPRYAHAELLPAKPTHYLGVTGRCSMS